jgi:hypothetical protein
MRKGMARCLTRQIWILVSAKIAALYKSCIATQQGYPGKRLPTLRAGVIWIVANFWLGLLI